MFEKMKEYLPVIVVLNLNIPSSIFLRLKMTLFFGFTMKKSINLFDVEERPTKYAPLTYTFSSTISS